MIFRRLRIHNWRQFRDIDLAFHDRLTVLTGANGSGKTTILNILSRHFGWQGAFVSTPRLRGTDLTFSSGYWTDDYLKEYEEWLAERSASSHAEPPEPPTPQGPTQEIGELTYVGHAEPSRLSLPLTVGPSFPITMTPQRNLRGLHIPSHRPIYSYQSVENIPTRPRERNQAFDQYMNIVRQRYYGEHTGRTPMYFMKETLISLATFGYGNRAVEPNPQSQAIFEGFQDVLRIVLPPSLGFLHLTIRLPEVVLVTQGGDFSLDAISGGIAALIDLAWQVFMYESTDVPFAVTLDEPENHLHPELQRTVLGTFLKAFPNVQFICATHNPFIVTSVPDSNTYALRHGIDRRVRSESLSTIDRSGTSNEILRDVLGLASSGPPWVEQNLRELQDQLSTRDLTPELVEELRERLHILGLERYFPTALARLAQARIAE